MNSREQNIAELLNSIPVRCATSDERWTDLISDYFTAPGDEERDEERDAETDSCSSESDSDSPANPSGESAYNDGESELEDGEEVDFPFMPDPMETHNVSDYSYLNEDSDKELAIAREYRCGCKLYNSAACYQRFTPEEMVRRRDQIKEMTNDEKHLVLLGKISSHMTLSRDTVSSRRSHQKECKHQKTAYFLDGEQICRETFKFLHAISQNKLTNLIKFYKHYGLAPRMKRSGGRVLSRRLLTVEDIQRLKQFITNFADVHAMPLPGRIPGFKRSDIQVLPTTETMTSMWRRYKSQMRDHGLRAAGNSTFRKLWRQLTPNIVIGKPMTDLCWVCQKNNIAIYRSSNLPDCVKSAKLRKQEQHLCIVGMERQVYQDMVTSCKATAGMLGIKLGPNPPCSRDLTMHYSFDYAQQVHYPSDPLQPGPVYFLVPRKCGVFGVCCEGVPQQVNYLIDEAHCISKGSNAVIDYLHHFFSKYGLGEKHIQLHCDNCSGQNKNKFVLWYLAWRCMMGLHNSVSLNFLISGHTKFAPDWCFGLFKKTFRRTPVSCLENICQAVSSSTSESHVNIPQLVGDETGQVFVQTHDWHSFLTPSFKPLPGVKKYHHFRFSTTAPGMVFAKEFASTEEEPFCVLRNDAILDPEALPTSQKPPGLNAQRQWYLYDRIREFCAEDQKDLVCPKPVVARP